MKPLLLLTALLLFTPALHAQSVTVTSKDCVSWGESLEREAKEFPQDWKIIVICDERTWARAIERATLSSTPGLTLAFTNLEARKTFINPVLFRGMVYRRKDSLMHELKHIHCNCSLGE